MTEWKAGKKAHEVIPFVDGWDFVGILGEGAFGEVRLVANSQHNIAAAAKIINLDDLSQEAKTNIEREIQVHKFLKHRNIIRYYSHRHHPPWNSHLIFMEYANGGELFDKLKPDVGMSEVDAQNYFRQLLEGVNYIHSKGFCHRDIKPENLLITDKGRLKIIDFGNAAPFFSRSTKRLKVMDKICGTAPYMAPEIWTGQGYFGNSVDVWSCGIVLIAMLSGELPWSKASQSDENYKLWCDGKTLQMPWNHVSIEVIQLSKKILAAKSADRIQIGLLLECDWLKEKKADEAFSVHSSKRLKLADSTAMSQPLLSSNINGHASTEKSELDLEFVVDFPVSKLISSSQPISDEMMVMATQTQSQTQSGQNQMILKSSKITRLGLNKSLINQKEIVSNVKAYLENFTCTMRSEGVWRFASSTKVSPLVILMSIYNVTSQVSRETFFLVDFTRSRGDSVQFRKVFRQIRSQFSGTEVKIPLGQRILMGPDLENETEPKEVTPPEASIQSDKHKEDVNEKENLPGNSQPMLPSNEDHETT